jgi:hypothetical protein
MAVSKSGHLTTNLSKGLQKVSRDTHCFCVSGLQVDTPKSLLRIGFSVGRPQTNAFWESYQPRVKTHPPKHGYIYLKRKEYLYIGMVGVGGETPYKSTP